MCFVGRALQEEVSRLGISQIPAPAPLCLPLAGCRAWVSSLILRTPFSPSVQWSEGASLMTCCEDSMRTYMLTP